MEIKQDQEEMDQIQEEGREDVNPFSQIKR